MPPGEVGVLADEQVGELADLHRCRGGGHRGRSLDPGDTRIGGHLVEHVGRSGQEDDHLRQLGRLDEPLDGVAGAPRTGGEGQRCADGHGDEQGEQDG